MRGQSHEVMGGLALNRCGSGLLSGVQYTDFDAHPLKQCLSHRNRTNAIHLHWRQKNTKLANKMRPQHWLEGERRGGKQLLVFNKPCKLAAQTQEILVERNMPGSESILSNRILRDRLYFRDWVKRLTQKGLMTFLNPLCITQTPHSDVTHARQQELNEAKVETTKFSLNITLSF